VERRRVCVVNVEPRGCIHPNYHPLVSRCSCVLFVTTVCVRFSVFPCHGGIKRHYEEVQPQTQKRIVEDYQRGVRGHGYKAIAKKHGLPVPTVQHVIERAERTGGNKVAPRGHKKRKLDGSEEAKLCKALDKNPTATNRQLRAAVCAGQNCSPNSK
jgi:transposase-like protein